MFIYLGLIVLGNEPYVLGNGLHGLGNAWPYVLGNGLHMLGFMSYFGIISHSGLCRLALCRS